MPMTIRWYRCGCLLWLQFGGICESREKSTHPALLLVLAVATGLWASVDGAATGAPSATATTAQPKGFSARSLDLSARGAEEEDDFETQAQTHLAYRQQQHQQQQQQRPQYEYSEEDQEEAPRQVYINRNSKQQSNYLKQQLKKPLSEESEEEEEEIEEPDRLSTLLSKSTFSCTDRNSGYYADESLSCEVFHYCQESQKHSWICPEGFTFHQIHLICMPPSHDNICKQSSKYHIVNDYLYKPINLQEHQSKPNVTLRYSERYFPENYYEHERYDDEEEELPAAPRPRIQHQQQQQHHQQPQQQQHRQVVSYQQPQVQHQPQPQVRVQYQQAQQQQQQVTQIRHQPQPQPTTLAYRKPQPTTTIQPQLQLHQLHQPQLQLHQQRPQTLAPTVTPAPYRFFTAAPQLQHLQQQHQQVFRTPEEINISLQQRRPQVFIATTPRYYEDEYLYERRK
ncbi:GATA zinc finger domain-containing protein 10 isoform X1 [Drosophila miranda]|uniref:GATA zinc finger domain-containing protein 10 isoform X1 n=1 Tax=Drosophila miranda TaxID=7229 RepID=UPI00143F06EE|nr:GATA zinc finger domain-containing protein 10 isoform X1 [Drosophila miranda]